MPLLLWRLPGRPPTRRHSGRCRALPVGWNGGLILLRRSTRGVIMNRRRKDEIELRKVRRAPGARRNIGFLPNGRMEMCELRLESA